jgi:pilus assembly protein Flp/PilA
MHNVMTIRNFRRFLRTQSGATAIEYALIAAGVAGAIVATITLLGGSVVDMWTTVSGAFG